MLERNPNFFPPYTRDHCELTKKRAVRFSARKGFAALVLSRGLCVCTLLKTQDAAEDMKNLVMSKEEGTPEKARVAKAGERKRPRAESEEMSPQRPRRLFQEASQDDASGDCEDQEEESGGSDQDDGNPDNDDDLRVGAFAVTTGKDMAFTPQPRCRPSERSEDRSRSNPKLAKEDSKDNSPTVAAMLEKVSRELLDCVPDSMSKFLDCKENGSYRLCSQSLHLK